MWRCAAAVGVERTAVNVDAAVQRSQPQTVAIASGKLVDALCSDGGHEAGHYTHQYGIHRFVSSS